jgi:hypothetical protein
VSYAGEAGALDAEILDRIERRSARGFGDLALRIFEHQLRYNEPYARYAAALGVTLQRLPSSWEQIPPVPAAAFKEAALCTFDPASAELAFDTSGTTQGKPGTHYMETRALYDAALLAGFHDAMLRDEPRRLRYLLLVPNPRERPRSSLGYMLRRVAERYGEGDARWFLNGDTLQVDAFVREVRAAREDGIPACVAGTAFAFAGLLERLEDRGIGNVQLPESSRVMETGGFKGRTRIVGRDELYGSLARTFAIPEARVVAEYGMTELTSQYYDDRARVKRPPPWLKPRVTAPDGATLPPGVVGSLVHVDLGNRSSCVAIQTEDLGVATGDGGIVLIGRERGAELRGCSLDAEQLRAL